MRNFKPEYRTEFEMSDGLRISHEMDGYGFHCLVIQNRSSSENKIMGEPTTYSSVAAVTVGDRIFVAFTAYYDGILPIEQPFELRAGTRCDSNE